MEPSERLLPLFDAERNVRRLHEELRGSSPDKLVEALAHAAKEAAGLTDSEEASLRLTRIALLLGELEGPRPVDLLCDLLGSGHPEVRAVAGEELEGVAYDRFKEVALGIERALERFPVGSPALQELPYLLAEVAEPGCVKLLGRFLKHDDADAVAAAIEALVELGDPSALPLLAPLHSDSRQVELDEDAEDSRVTIGELAQEAHALLEELAEPDPSPPPGKSKKK